LHGKFNSPNVILFMSLENSLMLISFEINFSIGYLFIILNAFLKYGSFISEIIMLFTFLFNPFF